MSDKIKTEEITDNEAVDSTESRDFIREAIDADNASGRFDSRVQTRFPPEPNGYLHIGHTKALCINFGIAEEYGGICNLRFDDTNPTKEKTDYVDAILEDIRWLGFDWGEKVLYASDYFEELYQMALEMIDTGQAFICELSAEEMREYRGTLKEPGRNSPYRDRPAAESRDLFQRMRAGEFAEGTYTLRAKIDMASPNINLRDPVMYRIIDEPHWRTGTEWPIYPMYDWAHGQSDSIEGVTHSLCSLEYLNHRPLYDHYLDRLEIHHPQQLEFARLEMNYTVTSKRKLLKLVEEGTVSGWDDPRMPTLAGLRRRGYTPESIRNFCDDIGLARTNATVETALLEYHIRQDLNRRSNRVMGVLNPLKVVIENYPEGQVEEFEAVNNPEDESAGTRMVPFSREIYIEREDFMEDPPRKFFRLAPGREVRLRYACLITCTDVIKDENGEVVEVRATWDPESKGGNAPDGRRVKGTLHWVSAEHAIPAEVRIYDRLFASPTPEKVEEGEDFTVNLNPDSLTVNTNALLEPTLAGAQIGERYQFERLGYFVVDPDSTPGNLVFNRTVPLRDSWAKIEKQRKQKKK